MSTPTTPTTPTIPADVSDLLFSYRVRDQVAPDAPAARGEQNARRVRLRRLLTGGVRGEYEVLVATASRDLLLVDALLLQSLVGGASGHDGLAERRLLQPRDDAEAGCAKDLPSFGRGNGGPPNRGPGLRGRQSAAAKPREGRIAGRKPEDLRCRAGRCRHVLCGSRRHLSFRVHPRSCLSTSRIRQSFRAGRR
jgi:hypothetical protein